VANLNLSQRKGCQCISGYSGLRLSLPDQGFLQRCGMFQRHSASQYLFGGSTHKAKLAYCKPVSALHRRPKGAAGHRPRSVQIAQTCLWIQHRAGLIVRVFAEALFKSVVLFRQHAGFYISRKILGNSCQ